MVVFFAEGGSVLFYSFVRRWLFQFAAFFFSRLAAEFQFVRVLERCSFFFNYRLLQFVARSREILSSDHVSLKFIVATLLQILCAWKFQQRENALQFKVRVVMNVSRNSNARHAKRTSLGQFTPHKDKVSSRCSKFTRRATGGRALSH